MPNFKKSFSVSSTTDITFVRLNFSAASKVPSHGIIPGVGRVGPAIGDENYRRLLSFIPLR